MIDLAVEVLKMDEYINRESLMKRFCERCNEEMSESPCEPSDCFAREVIKTIPSSDVAPVRHGRWEVEVGMNFFKERNCPVCKKRIESNFWNFCPNCGAKMDLEGLP